MNSTQAEVAHVTTGAELALAVETWLLSAAPDPKMARRRWREGSLAFLRCGGILTAIRIPGPMVHAATNTNEPRAVADCLTPRTLLGVPQVRKITYQGGESYWPVAVDSRGQLCLAAAVDGLAHEDLRCLGEGGYR
ncbi:hypothetical protein [Streptomyces sp. NPDC045251]|uniref:hypothetical protein n=1 Tax=unclassified Streptomyces TaxID=2593676 RepID=UPI0033E3CCAA